jgi:hypothetical protein
VYQAYVEHAGGLCVVGLALLLVYSDGDLGFGYKMERLKSHTRKDIEDLINYNK